MRFHQERLAVLYELKRVAGDLRCTNELVELGGNGVAELDCRLQELLSCTASTTTRPRSRGMTAGRYCEAN